MEESYLTNDIYFIIAKYSDYESLLCMRRINNIFNSISSYEMKKRLKSIFPFGEKHAKIKVFLNDILIEKISCILPNGYQIYIPPEKYTMYHVTEVLKTW